MSVASMIELLEAGVHFGHQTQRWNPKMKPYIYGARNGIYVFDLRKTSDLLDKAYEVVREYAARNKNVLFVGTKKQAAEVVAEEAKRAGATVANKAAQRLAIALDENNFLNIKPLSFVSLYAQYYKLNSNL